MENDRRKWSKREIIAALNLYYKIPFSKTVKSNPKIIALAKLINRTPSAVAMKLGNFGSFDPELKNKNIYGLKNSGKLDKEIWDKYYNNLENLAIDSEQILANYNNVSIEKMLNLNIHENAEGKEKEVIIKQRVGQSFFRQTILGIYDYKCCVSGLSQGCFLEACHISGWSKDISNRLNPTNGICLNLLLHKAFDEYIISITPDYKLVVNTDKLIAQTELEKNTIENLFLAHNNKKINLPDKFKPDRNFLEVHYDEFRRQ